MIRNTCQQHLWTPRGSAAMKIQRCYSSIAYLWLCPTQSSALVGNKTPWGTTALPITAMTHHHGSTVTSRFQMHPLSSSFRQQSSRHYSSSIDVDGGAAADLVAETSHLPRLYVTPLSLQEKHLVTLTPFQSNYLSVMRVTNTKRWGRWAGHVRIFNGRDGEWLAKTVIHDATTSAITTSSNIGNKKRKKGAASGGGDSTILECVRQTIPQPSASASSSPSLSSMPELHLHIGKLKKQRRKWVLEKATELGITAIDIVEMEYSEQMEPWEHEKHQAQVIEAAEQCERLTVPTLVTTPTIWSDLMENIRASKKEDDSNNVDHYWLVCRERSLNETVPILIALEQIYDDETSSNNNLDEEEHAYRKRCIHILVGPEGGWSPTELEDLANVATSNNTKSDNNLYFVSLGSLVLRAETATIAAVTAAMLAMDARQRS